MTTDAPAEPHSANRKLARLRRRQDFVRASKTVAGAVGRNRIRRRLKEALRVSGGLGARAGRDYVFVARRAALDAPFAEIVTQMSEGFARLDENHAANQRRKRKDRPAAP
jgi:ribonuclease P protein component